jgi:hypothetical protein
MSAFKLVVVGDANDDRSILSNFLQIQTLMDAVTEGMFREDIYVDGVRYLMEIKSKENLELPPADIVDAEGCVSGPIYVVVVFLIVACCLSL